MERKELGRLEDERLRFEGTFERYGKKSGWRGREEKTVLLRDIRLWDTDTIITNHLWFNFTKGFSRLKLKWGDIVHFNARVTGYEKGYFGYREAVYKPSEWDWKLSRPTKITGRMEKKR